MICFFGEGAPDFRAALARPAPGERTISNAEVPLPRSPLSLAAGTANRKAVLSVLWRVGDSEGTPPPGAWFAPCSSAARVQPRGCKGRSPLHKITFSLPLPAGKGVGGISVPFGEGGQTNKLKAVAAGDQKGKPPSGTTAAGIASAAGGARPRLFTRFLPESCVCFWFGS